MDVAAGPQQRQDAEASRLESRLWRVCYARQLRASTRRAGRGKGEPQAGGRSYMEVLAVRSEADARSRMRSVAEPNSLARRKTHKAPEFWGDFRPSPPRL
jgi:hypothetical protein